MVRWLDKAAWSVPLFLTETSQVGLQCSDGPGYPACRSGVWHLLLVQVRVKNNAEYPSLPKEVALRLVPKNGKTRRGETLLKPYLDADHVDRLCSAFFK